MHPRPGIGLKHQWPSRGIRCKACQPPRIAKKATNYAKGHQAMSTHMAEAEALLGPVFSSIPCSLCFSLPHRFVVPLHHLRVCWSSCRPPFDTAFQNQALDAFDSRFLNGIIKPTCRSRTSTSRRPYVPSFRSEMGDGKTRLTAIPNDLPDAA